MNMLLGVALTELPTDVLTPPRVLPTIELNYEDVLFPETKFYCCCF